jgi:hypothetical protein
MKRSRPKSLSDFAEHAAGYSANAESKYTRRVAHPQPTQPVSRHALRAPAGGSLPHLIRRTVDELGRTQARLRVEQDPAVRLRLLRRLEIAGSFLGRLGAEQVAEGRSPGPGGFTKINERGGG